MSPNSAIEAVVSGKPEINWFTIGTPWEVFSNFYRATVVLDGVSYMSVEHAYVAAKTTNLHTREIIRAIEKPGAAKTYGRNRVKLRPDWEEIKIPIMRDLVGQKFSKYPGLRKALVATDGFYIREGNRHGDQFWGQTWGPEGWVGLNHLGIILMETRDKLLKNYTIEFSTE